MPSGYLAAPHLRARSHTHRAWKSPRRFCHADRHRGSLLCLYQSAFWAVLLGCQICPWRIGNAWEASCNRRHLGRREIEVEKVDQYLNRWGRSFQLRSGLELANIVTTSSRLSSKIARIIMSEGVRGGG